MSDALQRAFGPDRVLLVCMSMLGYVVEYCAVQDYAAMRGGGVFALRVGHRRK